MRLHNLRFGKGVGLLSPRSTIPKVRYPQREMTIDIPDIQAWSPEFYWKWFGIMSAMHISCNLAMLISPPGSDSLRKRTYVLAQMFYFFLHSRDLRDAWADRREILQDGQ